MQVTRAATTMLVTDEQLADNTSFGVVWRRWLAATPNERQAMLADAAQRRADERAATPFEVELTLDLLLDKLGFSHAYARHLVQPYCTCGDTYDGWDLCAHARDLGLTTDA